VKEFFIDHTLPMICTLPSTGVKMDRAHMKFADVPERSRTASMLAIPSLWDTTQPKINAAIVDTALDIVGSGEPTSAFSIISHDQQECESSKPSRVRFSPYDQVVEIPHFKDYSDEEKNNIWFVSNELNAIKKECAHRCFRLEEEGNAVDFCVRGLDQHTKTHNEQRYAIKKIVQEGVFKLMKYQHSAGVDVSLVLSQLYKKLSSGSVTTAAEIGRLDALAAQA
jgi:hypothetical protein